MPGNQVCEVRNVRSSKLHECKMLLPRFEVLLKVFGCQDQCVVSELRLEATEFVFLEAIPLFRQEVVH